MIKIIILEIKWAYIQIQHDLFILSIKLDIIKLNKRLRKINKFKLKLTGLTNY